MKRLNIAFDMDGVLVDLMHVMRIKAYEMYDAAFIDNGKFQLETTPPLTNKEIWNVIAECYPMYKHTPVYAGARQFFQLLWDMAEEPIKIVTARPTWAAEDTYKQAKLISDVPMSIDIVQGGENKHHYLKHYDVFVEDRRKTAYDLAAHGKIVYLIDRPYNKKPVTGDPTGVIRITDIQELSNFAFSFYR